MPELPEVETTRRSIESHVIGHQVRAAIIREPRLRWSIPDSLSHHLPSQFIQAVQRRGKYLLFSCSQGTVILHFGMSGHLRLIPADTPPRKHDHFDIVLDNGHCLRLNDPRRFGAVLWSEGDPLRHPLLKPLGLEPLDSTFNGRYLFQQSHHRRTAVKLFIMDSHRVVGIGNIYANEALFRAGIHPQRAAGRISLNRYERLAEAIKEVLYDALRAGGTTLKDFLSSNGKPGYFSRQIQVYGRAGNSCPVCNKPIRARQIGQRASFYCTYCQH